MTRALKVLIVGGGIGGLTAALACAQKGHDVVLYEQAEQFGEVGAGLQISPNAMKVLRALGAAGRVSRDAVRPLSLRMRHGIKASDEGLIFDVPLGAVAEQRWGAPYLHLHRADYIEALNDLVVETPNIDVRLGQIVTDVRSEPDAAILTLSDGSHETGDVLIGADGLHSVVRASLHGPDSPHFTGNVAWRATVPVEQLGPDMPDSVSCVWVGPRRHSVTYRLRGGALVNFVGVVENETAGSEGWSHQGSKAEAQADFAGWHPTITRILERVPDDALYRWALYDRAPLPFWSKDRVTLLGDAAHPMLPFFAQGAAMATEDAWVLAQCLSEAQCVETALKRYEASRLPRASRVQAASRGNMKTFHRVSPLEKLITYGPMTLAGRIAPGLIRRRLDWLYGADVTQSLPS
ncbi:MAG: FAD-dependent oxidoreductase [Pseudomonadota bacterium]